MKKHILLYFSFLFLSLCSLQAANRYWVGGSGIWNDASHWSATSGGTGGASVPTINDDVIFDAHSFSADKQKVILIANAAVNSIDWRAITHRILFSASPSITLTVNGSYTLSSLLYDAFRGTTIFTSSQNNTSITTAGNIIAGNWVFNGTGTWTFSDDITTGNTVSIILSRGNIITNDKSITVGSFIGSGIQQRSINLTSSEIHIKNIWDFENATNLVFNAGASSIYFNSGMDSTHFRRGPIHYNNISPTITNTCTTGAIHITLSETDLTCNSSCNGTVSAVVTGGSGNYLYQWSPGSPAGQGTPHITGLCANTYTVRVTDNVTHLFYFCHIAVGAPPVLFDYELITTNPTCHGLCNGMSVINATGGTSPYTFNWLPGNIPGDTANNICANTYTITVTDAAGCTADTTILVTQPNVLTATGSSTNLLCHGFCNGTATVSASGGTTPYTYVWAPGNPTGQGTTHITNLCPSTYTCTVTDSNLCVATFTTQVTEPVALSGAITSQTNVPCHGGNTGSVTVLGSNGTPPYTYSINGVTFTASGTFNNLTAGSYTITIKDANGCTVTVSVTITQPNILTASISATALACHGDCNATAGATVSGGTPAYIFSWLPSGVTGNGTSSISALCAGTYTLNITDSHNCTATDSVTIFQPPVLTLDTITTNITCFGLCNGSATAVAGGGTPGYSFQWLPGGQTTATINNLCAGTYTVTLTDAHNCTLTQTVTITQPPHLLANPSIVNNLTCNGVCNGSATCAPTGGVLPYSYHWSPGNPVGQGTATITGLCASTYSVTVTDAHGCTSTQSVTISQPMPLISPITNSTPSCNICNGTATVTASGGTGPYTYVWMPTGQTAQTATGLCPNITYTVTSTDSHNCTATDTVTILQTVNITITTSNTTLSCFGSCNGTATANASGGTPPYSYLWTGPTGPFFTQTVNSLCAGTYTVKVTDASGCFNTAVVTFVNPVQLSASTTVTSVTCNGLCNGTATVVPTGGTAPYTYSWNTLPAQTTVTISGLCQGTYLVTVTDANGCTTTTQATITQPTPVIDHPTITVASCILNNGSISVTPSGGAGGYTYVWGPGNPTGQGTATITNLALGAYTLTITDAAGCVFHFNYLLSSPAGPTLVMSNTSITCHNLCNGTASVVASGGAGGYVYNWTPGNPVGNGTANISSLCAGTYTVQVTDAGGCVSLGTTVLANPTLISPNPTIVNTSCNATCNGSILLAPTGGAGSYAYTWSPGGQHTSSITNLCAGSYTVAVTDANGCDSTLIIAITSPPTLTVTLSSTNVSCNGLCNGTATASVTGGTPAYTYAWSNGPFVTPNIVGLCPNQYIVTVTDAHSCVAKDTVVITQPPVLTTSTSHLNISCNNLCNGVAIVSANGGTPAYTYVWNPGNITNSTASGLCAGTYTATVTDANGCTSSPPPVTITQPVAIIPNATFTAPTCNGLCNGTAVANPTGGTPPYTYLWMPGSLPTQNINNLCAGTYTITITDLLNCVATQIITIVNPAILNANASATPPTCTGLCNGSVTANPLGGTSPYTYSWTPIISSNQTVNNLCPGSYTVTVTDIHNCVSTQSATVIAPLPINAVIGSTPASCGICNGTINLTPITGTPPYTYLWNPAVTGQGTPNGTNICAGIYDVTITDAHGCDSTFVIPMNNSSGPTGQTEVIHNVICNGICNGSGIVTPVGGLSPYTYLWNNAPANTTIDSASNLCAGSYFVRVTDANGCIHFSPVTITQPTPIIANGIVSNATCGAVCNGSITVTPSGGTPGYTYNWAPGNPTGQGTPTISNICPGTYTLTITDTNLCTKVDTFTVGQSSPVVATAHSSVISCSSSCTGVSYVAITSGTSPYTTQWNDPLNQTNDTATALCAGSYSVLITDALGCTLTLNTTVTATPPVIANAIVTDATCGVCNGQIVATPTGGSGSYTYLWSNAQTTSSINNLCVGLYSVNITDGVGCTASVSVPVSNTGGPTNATINSTNVTCFGLCNGTVTSITPTGGTPPYTYLWITGGQTTQTLSNLCAGTYFVEITDANGCSFLDSVVITQPAQMLANPSTTAPTCGACNGAITINPSGCSGTFTVLWNNSSTALSLTSLCAGVYSVQITCSNGCIQNVVVPLSSQNGPTLVTSSTNTNCVGSCNGTAIVTATTGVPPYTYIWNNVPASITDTANGLCAGNYFVQVTGNNGCVSIGGVTIGQPQPLGLSLSSISNPTCSGSRNGTITAIPSGGTLPYTYTWSPSGGIGDVAVGLSVGSYTVTVIDAKGCSTTQTTIITNPPAIGVNSTVTNPSCNTIADGAINIIPSGGTPGYTYQWSGGSNATSPNISSLLPGTYIITVTDTHLCTFSDTIIVNSAQTVIANAGNDTTFCNLGALTLSAAGSTNGLNYQWFQLPGNTNVGNTVTVSVTPPTGTTNYYVIVDNGTGCSDNDTVAVTSTPLPTAHAGNDTLICSPSIILLNASSSVNAVSYQWFRLPGNISISNADTVSVIPPIGTTSYYVKAGNISGCFSTDTVNLTLNPVIIANAGNDTSICQGATITLNAGGSINGINYHWFQMPADMSVGNTAAISVTPPAGTTSYYVVVDNNTICTNNDTVTIPTIALPIAHAGNDSSICQPGAMTLNASTSINASTYQWFQMPTNTNVGNTAIVSVNPPIGTTNYYVVVSNGVCTDNDTVSFTVYALITANAGNDTSICAGATITLNASGSTNGTNYNWFQIPANSNVGSGVSISVSPPLGVTSYYVVVDNGHSCSANDTVIITSVALPIANAGHDTIICQSATVTINATGSLNGINYQWFQLPANTIVGNTSVVSLTPSIGTTGYYVNVNNGVGCSSNDTITITLDSLITARAGNDTTICQSSGVLLNASASTGNIAAYQWFQIPSTSIANTVTSSVTPPVGTTSYYVVVTNSTGCSDSDTLNVTSNPLPVVNAGTNITIVQGASTTLGGSPTGPSGSIYDWSPLLGLNDSTISNPVATPQTTTTYSVIVTSSQGCKASGEVTVTVFPNISFGTGISPNGDGVNDVWQIDYIENFPKCVVEVYNRWGELLFQSQGYTTKWDGTYKGKQLPVGTYYYIINLNDPLFPDALTGPITILR